MVGVREQVRRSLVDWHRPRLGGGIGLLAAMDRQGGEVGRRLGWIAHGTSPRDDCRYHTANGK